MKPILKNVSAFFMFFLFIFLKNKIKFNNSLFSIFEGDLDACCIQFWFLVENERPPLAVCTKEVN